MWHYTSVKEVIRLKDCDLNEELFRDVMFLSIDADGELLFYNSKGKPYYCNADISIKKIEKLFPPLIDYNQYKYRGRLGEKIPSPKEWKYLDMGQGHFLLVNEEVYEEFKKLFEDIDLLQDIEPVRFMIFLYNAWQGMADLILNGKYN